MLGNFGEAWNGTLLNSVSTVLEWAKTMTWKGAHPIVELLDKNYKKGIRIVKKIFKTTEKRLERDKTLPKYFVVIPCQII